MAKTETVRGPTPPPVGWELIRKEIPPACRQIFLPLYLTHPATMKLRGNGVFMCGLSNVVDGFLIQRRAGFHLIIFTEEGAGMMRIGEEERLLEPGSITFVPADQEHLYFPLPGKEHWKFFWFHLLPEPPWRFLEHEPLRTGQSNAPAFLVNAMRGFIAEISHQYALMGSDNQAPPFYVDAPHLHQSMIEFELKEGTRPPDDPGLAELYAELILRHLKRELLLLVQATETHPQAPRLDQLWSQVAEHPELPWSLESMAESMAMSVSTFLRCVRKIYGRTPVDIVIHIRLRRAAQLLAESALPVAGIAKAVGYESMSSFAAVFRRHFQCAPRDYRRQVTAGDPPAPSTS